MLITQTSQIRSFGTPSTDALDQLTRCLAVSGEEALGVLCADHHKGYGMPIGGVVASNTVVMPAGVGYDIGCGNYAVKTPLQAKDLDISRIMDEIGRTISFGVGRKNNVTIVDHIIFDQIAHAESAFQRNLLSLAQEQLGTVGSGNHYVDLFEDRGDGTVWIGVHFGSRGFGHKTATHFLDLTAEFLNMKPVHDMDGVPLALPLSSDLARSYLGAMELAGEYASAGRVWVVNRVLEILGTTAVDHVHNHHNYAWMEFHGGQRMLVTRKGATPAFPGQRGFVGGSMGDDAVIIEGIESPNSAKGLYSAMHGAGRVMGRKQAAGVWKKGVCVRPGLVDWPAALADLREKKIQLRGGGADEAPGAYKRLDDVLHAHAGTIAVTSVLRPIGVAMAGASEFDPYKD